LEGLKRIKSASKRVTQGKRQSSVGNNQDLADLGNQTDRTAQNAMPPVNELTPAYMAS
jgi:hypothetical protein